MAFRTRFVGPTAAVVLALVLASCSRTPMSTGTTGGGLPVTASASTASVCEGDGRTAGDSWYESNPTYSDPVDDSSDWPAASPSSGVDVSRLDAGVRAIQNSSLTSVLVVRHGALVYERYLNGASRSTSSNVHSASKIVIGAALAVAVREGRIPSLDARVSDLLPEYFAGASEEKKSITVRHLMTMSSGLAWTEDETEYRLERTSNWVEGILAQPLVATPGTTFEYSTGNTHVLSAILQRATGMNTCAFVHQRLFTPMNVTAEHWGRDPQGVSSGGYNVYLTPREMAKIGVLLLNGGTWKGQSLVPEWFVAEAQQPRFAVDSTYSFGELLWLRTVSGHRVFVAWGWGGQFIYVIPDDDIVLVATENTTDGHDNTELDLGPFIRDSLLPAL